MNKQEQDTTKDIIVKRDYDTTIDKYLIDVTLNKTMGDVVRSRDIATNVKQYTVACMVFNAVFETDVQLIKTLATRIDGTVPSDEERDKYANILGDAIEDVLSYPRKEQVKVEPSDPPIIAMAKALVYVGTQPVGNNMAKRKERNMAAEMILERTGGRKTKPFQNVIDIEYVEPEWMRLEEAHEQDPDRQEGIGETEGEAESS